MEYVLSPSVRAGFQRGILYFGFGSIQKPVEDRGRALVLLECASFWTEPHSVADAITHLTNIGVDDGAAVETVSLLVNGHFLLPAEAYELCASSRRSRNLLYYGLYSDPAKVERRLADSSVTILGCGGIGNRVAFSLAAAGIGHLILIDHDVIELTNLTRQFLFDEASVGSSKVKRAINERFSDIRVDYLDLEIKQASDSTTPRERLLLRAVNSRHQAPLVSAINDAGLSVG